MSWYFIETERFQEENVKEILLKSNFEAFVPKKEMYFKKGDTASMTLRLLFPGTVLIHDPESPPQFTKKLKEWIQKKTPGSEWIHPETQDYFALSPSEEKRLNQLLDQQKVLRFSTGIIKNRILHISKGPLQGHETEVQKIKRHQRLATLPVQLCGQTIGLIVGLKVIEKN